MIEIVYFTTKCSFNQEKKFKNLKEFNAWVKKMSPILMDYTVMKAPKELKIPLHFR